MWTEVISVIRGINIQKKYTLEEVRKAIYRIDPSIAEELWKYIKLELKYNEYNR